MLFADIPGLNETKATLISAVKTHHVAHAQLLMGKEGSAALSLALAFATYINCEDKQENDSCGVCPSCFKFKKLIHPDLHFVFPVSTTKTVTKDPMASLFMKEWRGFVGENPFGNLNAWANYIGAENKQLNISVEESRNIIKTVSLKSFEAEYKILIIWMAEQMHPSASNAILKVLEEPPAKTIFLLITEQPEKILTTIQSRTQKIIVRSFSDEEVKNFLIKKYNLEEKNASRIAYLADGNMNEAIRLMGEEEEDHHQMFRDWMRICYKGGNVGELVEWCDMYSKLGKESQKNLLYYGLSMMRESLVYRVAGERLLRLEDEELKFVSNFSKVLSEEKISRISEILNEAAAHIERNANPKITFLDISFGISATLKK